MVLDAKTLLVFLRGEAGQDRVIRALVEGEVCISTVTLIGVLSELRRVAPRAVLDDLHRIGLEIVPVDVNLAMEVAKLGAPHLPSDAVFALALAKSRGLEVLASNIPEALAAAVQVKVQALR
jgi:PIN domain nuclease of toxin-antitoxin system